MKRKPEEEDPFHDIREMQEHRLDPGYWIGGRIHPMYRSSRPNRWGWVLIAVGVVAGLTFAWILFSGGASVVGLITIALWAFLSLVAGIRVVR